MGTWQGVAVLSSEGSWVLAPGCPTTFPEETEVPKATTAVHCSRQLRGDQRSESQGGRPEGHLCPTSSA